MARRLELEIRSLKLRYLDEDNDNILLACDDDLQLCLRSLTAVGEKTSMHVFVQSIRVYKVGASRSMSTFQGWEGSGDHCCITEFTGYLQNPDLSSTHHSSGWVFWYDKTKYGSWKDLIQIIELPTQTQEKDKIQRWLEAVTSDLPRHRYEFMLQFWTMKEGCLTTEDQPFGVVGALYKGYSWYRKLCEAHQYSVKEEEGVGSVVRRVYLDKNPESTPDLMLYSTHEFALRNEAASCGLRSYLAMPVFDLSKMKCYGVLEIVSCSTLVALSFSLMDYGLKKAGFGSSTLISFSPIIDRTRNQVYQQSEREVVKIMELAIELVPQLHLVQLWKQCVNRMSFMQRIAFIEAKDKRLNFNNILDCEMENFVEACRFHHPQIGKWMGGALVSVDRKSFFCRNICDFSILENPLAHYAQRARLSSCFVLLLENLHHSNHHYFLEFFFHSNCGGDACDDSFLHLLLKIIEMELRNFKFEKSVTELSRKTGALTTYEHMKWKHQHSEVNMLMTMKGHKERYSPSHFRTYLQKADLSCQVPCGNMGWIFFGTEKISDNGAHNNSALPYFCQDRIKILMMEIATSWPWRSYSLVQFWAFEMKEDRPCLQTSDQPFILTSLDKGLAFFRKQSMEHHYFVDEEVGPLQRVFQSGHPEMSPDLRLYSATEFPLRDHALHCLLSRYLAFPVLDQHKKCIGVLECVGTDYGHEIELIDCIQRALKAASLCSTHINLLRSSATRNVYGSRRLANNEICRALQLLEDIPELFLADVWVTHNKCESTRSNISCMELFKSSESDGKFTLPFNFHEVQTRKGIVGMVLASENKSFLCRNLCHFSIADEPRSHYLQRNRLDVCFAICLKSSHTGNLLYVLQFFLCPGPAKYEYVSSFLQILFQILKQELTSFKVASGQPLVDGLVVDVIKFSQCNQLTSSELDESYFSPFKFRNVFYGQKDPQHSNNEQPRFVPDVMDSIPSIPQAKPSNAATSESRDKEKLGRKRNGSLTIRFEDLQPHFGKRLKQVAEALGVGKSTIKRACRRNGVDRWPSSQKYLDNPSLFEAAGTSQHSGSTNLPPPDMSLLTNLPLNNVKTTMLPVTDLQPESESVMVKAKYEDEIIKFKLSLSSTMNNLLEEVARRLELEIGSFKLRYLDEDNDKILLACDDDLQLCLRSLTAAGDKICMQLFVQSIRK